MQKLGYLKKCIVNFWQDIKEPYKVPIAGIKKINIGASVEKRPIYCYKIGSGERKILFVSAIHGNEIGTIKLAYFLLDYLSSNENEFGKLTIFIVPCLNIDGFEVAKSIRWCYQGIRGRLNAHKVDLNRNFSAPNFRSHSYVLPRNNNAEKSKYNQEVSLDSLEAKNLNLTPKNCGNFGGSELETQTLVDLVAKEKMTIIFSFHNVGRDVMGGQDELSQEIVKIYSEKTGYEILSDDEWRKIGQTGTMKDWCNDRNISFVEVEGSTRYGSDWKVQEPAIKAVLEYINGINSINH